MRTSPGRSLSSYLFTDFYQLTMAHLYFRMGIHEQEVQFDHSFRSYPDYGEHAAGFCINAGLASLLDWMQTARLDDGDLEFLRAQRGRTGRALFHDDFLHWLRRSDGFDSLGMWAIPEGRVVHATVPLTVVQGPFAIAQILESSLLNHLNYQTLVATKAARIKLAARGQPILEFGMRRAHGDAANQGARAAMIGGADFTSNTQVSRALGYPPRGTHAHSMVQAFMALGEGEIGAFRAYADVYPDDCLLLVDTIDTLQSGIPNAITVFEELRRKGHEPVGIRLDSGDLAYLAVQAAKMLDEAGFTEARIVLSNQLDELVIWQIIAQIAEDAPGHGVDADRLIRRLVYGVGTRLITSAGDGALDGVYKLVAVKGARGEWRPAIKISENPAKTPNPGNKRVWRLYGPQGHAVADLLALADEDPRCGEDVLLHHPSQHDVHRVLARREIAECEPLLVEVMQQGRISLEPPDLEEIRRRRTADIARLDAGVKRLLNPHRYHVSLTARLWDLKQTLVEQAIRGES